MELSSKSTSSFSTSHFSLGILYTVSGLEEIMGKFHSRYKVLLTPFEMIDPLSIVSTKEAKSYSL